MLVAYIAAPYTNKDPWIQECNIRAAEAIGKRVAEIGAVPIIPHSNTRSYFTGVNTPGWWYDATLELLRRSDVLVLGQDWRSSKGARKEMAEALGRKMPIFESVHPLFERDLRSAIEGTLWSPNEKKTPI